jgi:hypothetical protein
MTVATLLGHHHTYQKDRRQPQRLPTAAADFTNTNPLHNTNPLNAAHHWSAPTRDGPAGTFQDRRDLRHPTPRAANACAPDVPTDTEHDTPKPASRKPRRVLTGTRQDTDCAGDRTSWRRPGRFRCLAHTLRRAAAAAEAMWGGVAGS